MRFAGYVALFLWTSACGGGDIQSDDRGGKNDAAPDARDETVVDAIDTTSDTSAGCSLVEQGSLDPPTDDTKKFAVAVFHYNIQYVAGGLIGIIPPEQDPDGMFAYDNDQLEDRIVLESFDPLLDIFLEHPTFAGDIELQGYMLDVMMDRHHAVVEKMRTLVERGQIAVESFHYSDQLFTAHSRWSMEKSIELNKAAFGRACLPLSGSVFTQEGQFSEGMLELMKTAGQTVGIMKNGLFDYQYSDVPDFPLYTLRGQDVVVTRSFSGDDLSVKWYFVGDGETVLTAETDPYLGTAFQFSQQSADALIEKLEKLQSEGYFLTTVEDYINRVKGMGFEPEELPFSIDGTWRPDDSDNLFAWMGRSGLWQASEADNDVLASLESSRVMIEAAFAALTWAFDEGLDLDCEKMTADLDVAVRRQVLSEVSDSTGWNPWIGEVDFSLDGAVAAREAAEDVLGAVRDAAGESNLLVDLDQGTVVGGSILPENPWGPAEAPFDIDIEAFGFDVFIDWQELVEGVGDGYKTYRPDLTLKRLDDAAHSTRISFPRTTNIITYTPAMLDDETADIALADIGWDEPNLPLANGLIGLGNGSFLIKDIRSFHLSAFIPKETPEVFFKDMTLNGEGPYIFVFYVLTGATAEEARKEAFRRNIKPMVLY